MQPKYRNKHNGGVITILDSEITDDGVLLHYVERENGDKTYVGDYSIEKHWVRIDEEQFMSELLTLRNQTKGLSASQTAELAVDTFTREHLIEHLTNLYERVEAHDACDTHSQTLITSDEEEEI